MSQIIRRIIRAQRRAAVHRTYPVQITDVVLQRMPEPEPVIDTGPWSVDPVRHWMPDPRRMQDPEYRAHWREIEKIQPEDKYGDWTYVDTEGWAT